MAVQWPRGRAPGLLTGPACMPACPPYTPQKPTRNGDHTTVSIFSPQTSQKRWLNRGTLTPPQKYPCPPPESRSTESDPDSSQRREGKHVSQKLTKALLYTACCWLGERNRLKSKREVGEGFVNRGESRASFRDSPDRLLPEQENSYTEEHSCFMHIRDLCFQFL